MIGQFIYNILIAIDQASNTLLLGHPDETLSSRLGRSIGVERYFWVSPLREFVDLIFWFDSKTLPSGVIIGHCEKSVMPLEQINFRRFIDYEIWSWSKPKRRRKRGEK